MASCLKICYYSFRIDGFSKLITTPVRTSQKPEYNRILSRKANARNVGFGNLYGDQFTLSTQFIILNYHVQQVAVVVRR